MHSFSHFNLRFSAFRLSICCSVFLSLEVSIENTCGFKRIFLAFCAYAKVWRDSLTWKEEGVTVASMTVKDAPVSEERRSLVRTELR